EGRGSGQSPEVFKTWSSEAWPAGPADAGRRSPAGRGRAGAARFAGRLDVYAGLFGDDLDAVAKRLDEAVAARDADYLRTGTAVGEVVDLAKRRSPGR
ncbi:MULTISPECIES: hypothetical protein, partial [unclassified Micromonospora]|uniref:hypothetical protein n=1 Tax=unclassified Micromonospora TaxID=2617518 RepID=UPI002FF3A243